jgi:hypothetical protein
MIDIATEWLLSLKQAAKIFPPAREGRPVSAITLYRLILSGKLEALHQGNRWLTSTQAIQRYLERQTEEALEKAGKGVHPSAVNLHRDRLARQKQQERIIKECEAAGI